MYGGFCVLHELCCEFCVCQGRMCSGTRGRSYAAVNNCIVRLSADWRVTRQHRFAVCSNYSFMLGIATNSRLKTHWKFVELNFHDESLTVVVMMRKISVFYFISCVFCACGCVYECVSREGRLGCPDLIHHLVLVGQGLSLYLVLGWPASSSRILLSLSLLLFTELESNKKDYTRSWKGNRLEIGIRE